MDNPHHFPHKYKTLEELNNALIKAGREPINRYLERRACGCAIAQTMKDELEMEWCEEHKEAMAAEFERTKDQRPPGHYIIKDTQGAPIIEQNEPTSKTNLYPIETTIEACPCECHEVTGINDPCNECQWEAIHNNGEKKTDKYPMERKD